MGNNEGKPQETRQERRQRRQMEADYKEALKLGEVLAMYGRVMLIGPGGVGKSSLLNGLMNIPLPDEAESTILAETLKVKPFWVKAGAAADGHWVRVTEEDEIKELVDLTRLVVHQGAGAPQSTVAKLTTLAAATAVRLFSPMGFKPPEKKTAEAQYTEFAAGIQDSVVQQVFRKAFEAGHDGIAAQSVPHSEVVLNVWDCGGQRVFLDVLPAFLTSRTMFLLLFDARKPLNARFQALIHRGGRVISTQEEQITTLQLLLQWMASIHATLCNQDKHPEYPRIIPVGTYGDDSTVKAEKDEILRTLSSSCANKSFTPLLLHSTVVDNKTAGLGDDEDPAFSYIRGEINQFITAHLSVPTPIAWVLFRKVFQKFAEEQQSPVVPYEHAIAIGQVCGISQEVLPSVLGFYHELAVFLHYTSIESLRHYIIADPKWLIQQLGKLLAPEGFQATGNEHLWKLLHTKGILVESLFEEVWKGCGVQPKALIGLLEHFHLVAPISTQLQDHPFPGTQYFVPCMIQSQSDHCVPPQHMVKQACPLHLMFSTQYVPPGYFTRLATLLSKEAKCKVLFDRGIFRNRITLAYGTIDEVTITEHPSSVQVDIVRLTHRSEYKPMFRIICREVLKLIQACSAYVRKWLPSIKLTPAVRCVQCESSRGTAYPDPSPEGPRHFIMILSENKADDHLRCDKNEIHLPTPDQGYWLKIPEDGHGVPLSDAELEGVAKEVNARQKLKELTDEIEMVPHMQSLEGIPKATKILRRWSHVTGPNSARSYLVQHLKVIGLHETAHKVSFQEFEIAQRSSAGVQMSEVKPSVSDEPPTPSELRACARYIQGDVLFLASALNISDEKMESIKSRFKNPQSQALEMLTQWQSEKGGGRQELAGILNDCGFPDAAKIVHLGVQPSMRDLLKHVKTTKWYRLGLELDIDDYSLQVIQTDHSNDNKKSRKAMFQKWLDGCVNPTWKTIADGLRGIGDERLALDIEQKFCTL